jgi:hypothetical protein
VMPLLAGGRLVGRVDPVRRGRTLVARQVSLDRPSAAEPMARALREAATWVGCDQVQVERVTPEEITKRLRALLGLSGAYGQTFRHMLPQTLPVNPGPGLRQPAEEPPG